MKIIKPSYKIETPIDKEYVYKLIEAAGRVCYKSEAKTTATSAEDFIRRILKSGHESVIEHYNLTVRFVCDRGILAELTRHRLASFSVESSRYCSYIKDQYGSEITVIKPNFLIEGSSLWDSWVRACETAEKEYMFMLKNGATPQEARSVLPNSLKTEIVMTCNLRELRHILRLRTSNKAHPQIREIMMPLLMELKEKLPVFFEDIN